MKYLITCLTFLLFFHHSNAQSQEEDSLQLAQAIEWLEGKLTYHYYNVDDNEWWINRFTYNRGSQTVTIKNIASPRPQAVTDKTYLELNFRLKDLNPYTINVEERTSNAGRLVAGKTIRVGAFDNNAISRTKNGRLSTKQSFIYFSIPKFFEDSVASYSQDIVDKLTLAVELATKIYPQRTDSENVSLIKPILRDRFKSDNNYWVFRQPFPELFEILILDTDLELIGKQYLRIPDDGAFVELTKLYTAQPPETYNLNADEENGLHFMDEQTAFTFETEHKFTFFEKGVKSTFIRDATFDWGKAKYR